MGGIRQNSYLHATAEAGAGATRPMRRHSALVPHRVLFARGLAGEASSADRPAHHFLLSLGSIHCCRARAEIEAVRQRAKMARFHVTDCWHWHGGSWARAIGRRNTRLPQLLARFTSGGSASDERPSARQGDGDKKQEKDPGRRLSKRPGDARGWLGAAQTRGLARPFDTTGALWRQTVGCYGHVRARIRRARAAREGLESDAKRLDRANGWLD